MTFYILFSVVAILVAIVGCAVIWGYDVVRADRSAADVRDASKSALDAADRQREVSTGRKD